MARHGHVDPPTLAALERLKKSGRRLLLVTGRRLEDLLTVFDRIDVFDKAVVENGAVLYDPASREIKVLCEPPPQAFVDALRARGVSPLDVGHAIVSTWEPHQQTTLEVIHEQGLELQVVFNKGAVMILPSGVNKGTGLAAALHTMRLSPHNVVAVGDAENDHALLALAEAGVAVANALPSVKERADLVTTRDHGDGVAELVELMIAADLAPPTPRPDRHDLTLGKGQDGTLLRLPVYGASVLIAGTSGSGKSTVASALLEQLSERQYQYCVIDPEGDYAGLQEALVFGDARTPPAVSEVLEVLSTPSENVVVNLLGIPLADRPAFFTALLPKLQALRAGTGHPHWFVIDEAHHLLPAEWDAAPLTGPRDLHGFLFITVHPEHVSSAVLRAVDVLVAIGEAPERTLDTFSAALGAPPPVSPGRSLESGEALVWKRSEPSAGLFLVQTVAPHAERRRHVRKYATGELGPDRSFYFRGPEGKLNLRAQNLGTFLQLAAGVDDETWLHHLERGDYSRWFREAIKDQDLAEFAATVERGSVESAAESREAIKGAIEERYTAPE
jgi:hydroxymethylpyrimidine pyrophosphatase-like HAD family hydrolase/energy-coupling factor transporter ATP-binding protein EcfA2